MEWVGRSFVPYGPAHWSMLALTAVGAVVLILVGRRLRDTVAVDRLCRVFAVIILVISLGYLIVWLLPQHINRYQSIPLQLSDLLRYVSAYALWSRRRLPVALTYYWGLTLNPQAILTPNLVYQISPLFDFTAYWSQHILVMWAALFLTWGLGRHPDWGDYRWSIMITAGWAVVALTVNQLAGTNYGYLSRRPPTPSLLDLLPDWPGYLLVEAAAVIMVWALISWPWMIMEKRRPPEFRYRSGTPASPD